MKLFKPVFLTSVTIYRNIYSRTLKTQHLHYGFFLSEYRMFPKKCVELKRTTSLLNFNTKNKMPVSVINATSREINGYVKFNKNKLLDESMGTKKVLNVHNAFWKERPKHNRMLLVGDY